jgi:hypothetical protein
MRSNVRICFGDAEQPAGVPPLFLLPIEIRSDVLNPNGAILSPESRDSVSLFKHS